MYIPASQLEMFKSLNAAMKKNQEYLASQEPEQWEYSHYWRDLVTEVQKVKINWAVQQFRNDIAYSITL